MTSDMFSEDFRSVLEKKISSFKSEKARRNYRNLAADICEKEKKDFLLLTSSDVADYLKNDGRKSIASLRTAFSSLKSIACACDEALGTDLENSFHGHYPGDQDTSIELTDLPIMEDIDKVLTFLKSKGDMVTFAIISLALETGLSTDEICGLRFKNFNIDSKGNPYIRFEPPFEGGNARIVPLKAGTAALIEKIGSLHTDAKSDDHIFRSQKGNPLSQREAEERIHTACARAGVEGFTINHLRNLSMVYMMKAGAPVKALSSQLNVTGNWFFRMSGAVDQLTTTSTKYNHITVSWE